MKFVYNENVGGLQILIVYRVGLQIQHNGDVVYRWQNQNIIEKVGKCLYCKVKKN